MMLKKIVLLSILSLASAQDFFAADAADKDDSVSSSSDDESVEHPLLEPSPELRTIMNNWKGARAATYDWFELAIQFYCNSQDNWQKAFETLKGEINSKKVCDFGFRNDSDKQNFLQKLNSANSHEVLRYINGHIENMLKILNQGILQFSDNTTLKQQKDTLLNDINLAYVHFYLIETVHACCLADANMKDETHDSLKKVWLSDLHEALRSKIDIRADQPINPMPHPWTIFLLNGDKRCNLNRLLQLWVLVCDFKSAHEKIFLTAVRPADMIKKDIVTILKQTSPKMQPLEDGFQRSPLGEKSSPPRSSLLQPSSSRIQPLSRNTQAQEVPQQPLKPWHKVGIAAGVVAGLGAVAGLSFGLVKFVKFASAYSRWKKRNPRGNFKLFLRVRNRKLRS